MVVDSKLEEEEDDDTTFLGEQVLFEWKHCSPKLEHDFAISAWALSVMPEVREDINSRKRGEKTRGD